MFGALIGGALSAVGSIAGGIKSARAIRKARRNVQVQGENNDNWYANRYNEDATQRADAQRLLTMTEDAIKKRNQAAAGTRAVMGGTEASVAATKEANNEAYANAVSKIAADGEERKDKIEETYMQRKDALNNKLESYDINKASNIASAIQGVAGAAGNIANAFSTSTSKKTSE